MLFFHFFKLVMKIKIGYAIFFGITYFPVMQICAGLYSFSLSILCTSSHYVIIFLHHFYQAAIAIKEVI